MHTSGPIDEARRFLRDPGPILVLAHRRPDGDAFGSVIGLHLALQAAGRDCVAYLGGPPASRYARLINPTASLYVGKPPPEVSGRRVVALDTTAWDRLEKPGDVEMPREAFPVLDIDHHPDNAAFGDAVWVAPDRAATAQMLVELLAVPEFGMGPEAASWLLVGLVMDTGGFRFTNTDPGALRTAAALVELGADYSRVMDTLFFREPYARRRLEAELLDKAIFKCDGKFVFSVLESKRVGELGLTRADTEGVIDILRGFDGPMVSALFQAEPDFIKLSLRSRSPRFRVDAVAHAFGGGGHHAAAGAEIKNMELDTAIAKVVERIERVLSE